MHDLDICLQSLIPVAAVPLHSPFEPATLPGEKLWVARNGLFVEITRPWCRFVRKIGEVGMPVPYGALSPDTQFTSSPIPEGFLEEFDLAARRNSDVEIGASIIWNADTDRYRLAFSVPLQATGSSLIQQLPELDSNEHLMVDLHSHARHPAFFSSQDDLDDADQVKLAYVVGDCHQPKLSKAMRLCLRGRFETILPYTTPPVS